MIAAPMNDADGDRARNGDRDDAGRESDQRDVTVIDHQGDDRQSPAERLSFCYEFDVIRIALDPLYGLLIH